MWLINTTTLQLDEFFDASTPKYAILSHTWGAPHDEVSFIDMMDKGPGVQAKAGFAKITQFCRMARLRGHRHAWVDTCCIDKRNSTDLSEAINSMFRYYAECEECFIYLADVAPVLLQSESRDDAIWDRLSVSRWFTRGWTLQELIAPRAKLFFTRDWTAIKTEVSLLGMISTITGVDLRLLQNPLRLDSFCVGVKMSWASRRQTTRSEDMAYCLMGLFGICMPVLYGEGEKRAFRRLQEEIMRVSADQTIFLWKGKTGDPPFHAGGLLARSPSWFANTPRGIGPHHFDAITPFTMTNLGLSVRLHLIPLASQDLRWLPFGVDSWTAGPFLEDGVYLGVICDIITMGMLDPLMLVGLYLAAAPMADTVIGDRPVKAYRRIRCDTWLTIPSKDPILRREPSSIQATDCLVLEAEHYRVVTSSKIRSVLYKSLMSASANRTGKNKSNTGGE
jgi:hypothetical protein